MSAEREQEIKVEMDDGVLSFSPTLSLQEVSDQIKNQLAPQRVVTEVFMDEKHVGLEEEMRLAFTPISRLGRLAFRSKEVGALIRESLELAPQICAAMEAECHEIKALFSKADLTEAHERVGELSALMDWLLQLITGLQSYGEKDFRSMSLKEGTPLDSVRRMESYLSRLHHHLSSKNFESFCELLVNDFLKETTSWTEMFQKACAEWTPKKIARVQ
jgi:hypothetical protein